jgi:hypothetical protein
LNGCRPKQQAAPAPVEFAGKPAVPVSIMQEHQYLLGEIDRYQSGDSTGRVAARLKELMDHHFSEEEDYALPPLGILTQLSSGRLPANADSIILLTEHLRAQSDHMTLEHQMIKAYLGELRSAALMDHHADPGELEKKILAHARAEEEIYFPVALLIGEYLKLRTKTDQP